MTEKWKDLKKVWGDGWRKRRLEVLLLVSCLCNSLVLHAGKAVFYLCDDYQEIDSRGTESLQLLLEQAFRGRIVIRITSFLMVMWKLESANESSYEKFLASWEWRAGCDHTESFYHAKRKWEDFCGMTWIFPVYEDGGEHGWTLLAFPDNRKHKTICENSLWTRVCVMDAGSKGIWIWLMILFWQKQGKNFDNRGHKEIERYRIWEFRTLGGRTAGRKSHWRETAWIFILCTNHAGLTNYREKGKEGKAAIALWLKCLVAEGRLCLAANGIEHILSSLRPVLSFAWNLGCAAGKDCCDSLRP